MSNLISQPNIGKELAKKLGAVGIESFEQLKEELKNILRLNEILK